MTGDAQQSGVTILRAAGNDIIEVDPAALAAFAGKLRAQAEEIEGIAAGLDSLSPSVTSLGDQFIVAQEPRPVYKGTVGQLTTTTEAFQTQLARLATRLTTDADGLAWIAGKFAENQVETEADIRRIIDSVDPPSS